MAPSWGTANLLAVALAVAVGVADGEANIDLSCQLRKRQSAPTVGLSVVATDGIPWGDRRLEGQSSSSFQARNYSRCVRE